MVMMVTVALMVGEMWVRWLSESGYNLDVSQSRGPGFEAHPAAFECWASSFTTRCLKSLRMLLVYPKRIAVGV